jgi:serine/threonine protein kinase
MHLTAAEWARIEQLFPLAAGLAAVERTRFLDRECAAEPRVRGELEAMLAAADGGDRLLDAPVALTATAPPPAAEELAAGTRLGSWKVRTLIGHGGMGEVYLAERADGAYAMNAAVKLLKRELFSYDNAQRFLRERRVLARLSHPNIARVLDAGTTDDGRPYLVMEYVHGARITDHARAHGLSPAGAARLMLAVAEAVAEAHRRGVVHRDLKPANVLVDGEQQVKLLDFGIARLMDEDDSATRVLPMTPAYAAPEQVRGETLTPAADVYALGVMLFQLLTERLPHSREGMPLPVIAAGLRSETVEAPSRVAARREGLAGDLDWITLKALRQEPQHRYANAGEFADDLRRHLEHRPVLASPGSLGYRLTRLIRRLRRSLSAG